LLYNTLQKVNSNNHQAAPMNPVKTTDNIEIGWYGDKQRIILCRFKNMWTWHECRDAMQVAIYMQDTVEYPVSYIYDLTESKLTSRALMDNVKKLIELVFSPAPEKVVIVDKGTKLHLMVDMLERLFPQSMPDNIQFAESLTRAETIIRG
jgi:hypothetical protein